MKSLKSKICMLSIIASCWLPAQAEVMLCSRNACGEHYKFYSIYTFYEAQSIDNQVVFQNGNMIHASESQPKVVIYQNKPEGGAENKPVEVIKVISRLSTNKCEIEHIYNGSKKIFEYSDCENLHKLIKTQYDK